MEEQKNSHDIFINLDGALEIAIKSSKPKAVKLVKTLINRGVKNIKVKHQLAIQNKRL